MLAAACRPLVRKWRRRAGDAYLLAGHCTKVLSYKFRYVDATYKERNIPEMLSDVPACRATDWTVADL